MKMKVGTTKKTTKRRAKARRALNTPVHGTGEWARSNVNLQTGCRNGCKYCYACGNAVRYKRSTPDTWKTPVVQDDKVNKGYAKRDGRIMFPSSHDIDEYNIEECITVLLKLLAAGNDVLVVSKPRLECIRRLCAVLEAYMAQVTFRFTVGSADDRILQLWEPGAPVFSERLAALKYAHAQGFATSVSAEPMLDSRIDKVVDAVSPYVTDAIWLGRANRLVPTVSLNTGGDPRMLDAARELAALHNDESVRRVYDKYKDNPLIKFKDSIKAVVGLDRPSEKGLDI